MRKLLSCCLTSLAALVAVIIPCNCAPAVNTRSAQEQYLRKFSHLGTSNPDPRMAALEADPETQFHMAIRSFQRFAGVNITGQVDVPTLRMMQTPRCGVADLVGFGSVAKRRKRRFISPGSKWQKTDLTYRFDMNRFTQDLHETTVKREFRRAIQAWSDVSPLTFRETNAEPDIDIIFGSFEHGDNGPFDGPGGTLAHAYFPGDGIGGDAHFDDSETFTSGKPEGTNLFQVAVHELGHSLGLGHSDDQSAVMAPFYRGFNPSFTLGTDDIDGIRYIYGSKTSPIRPTQPPSRTTTTTTRRVTRPTQLPPISRQLQAICNNPSFDAIDIIDGTLHAFQGQYYIQLNDEGRVMSGSPKRISDRWPGVPSNLDAVVSSDPNKGPTFFFKGSDYWRYSPSTSTIAKRPINGGFPGVPDNIDAAFMWSGNNQLYFIKGDRYYKHRGGFGVDPDYPKPMRYWHRLPSVINDAFRHKDGQTYFFSSRSYYIFNDVEFKAGSSLRISNWLQDCSNPLQDGSNSATTTTTTKLNTSRHLLTSLALLTIQLVIITFASTANHIARF